jgi:predicted regulator of Ras-like GTPase activity (Roadblock/LC7/MglB family)
VPGLKDDLQNALIRLNQSAPEIRASAFVSLDGLMLASALPSGTNEDAIAAMSATVLGLGERTTKEFVVGELEQVYFKGRQGYIILQAAGEDGALVAVTDETAKLGILFLLLKRASDEIRLIVSRAIAPRVPESPSEAKPSGPGVGQPKSPWST